MARLLALGLLLALFPSLAVAEEKHKLVGAWKLVSIVSEFQDSGEKRALFGQSPRGHQAFTPEGRVIVLLTAEGRKPARTDADFAMAYRSMAAFSGTYRVAGDKLATKIDVASAEAWVGTERVATFKLDGDRLHITGAWTPSATQGGKMIRSVSVWEREK